MPKEVDAIQARSTKHWPALKTALSRLKKLLPDELQSSETFIVGGSIIDAIQSSPIALRFEPSKDIDLFFPNEEAFTRANEYFAALEEPGGGSQLVYHQPNKTSYVFNGVKFDLVSSVYNDTPDELVDLVDFTVSTGAFDLRDDHFCSHRLFFQDVAAKALRAHALPNPTKTMFRMPRYVQRGFWPDYGTLTRIGKNIEANALEEAFLTTPPDDGIAGAVDEAKTAASSSAGPVKLFDWTELNQEDIP